MLARTRPVLGGRLALATMAAAAATSLGIGPAADGAIIAYFANLSGPNESPPVASPGIGSATVTIDTVLHTMRVQVTFSGLLANTTACHIHSATAVPFAGNAGVATQTPSFVGFPLGVTSGSMDQTYDMTLASSWNPTFVTNNGGTTASAETALFNSMAAGTAYLNIHSVQFGSGEIRGFLAVPAPGTVSLLALAAFVGARRRRRA